MTQSKPLIAVVGLAGIFPDASDAASLWQNIVNRRSAARAVPDFRWITGPREMVSEVFSPDRAISNKCCLVDPLPLDPTHFNLGADLINSLDPMYHLVLSAGKTAVQEPVPIDLKRDRTGVVLAAIALPTDSSSAITRDLFTRFFEMGLFGQSTYRWPSTGQRLAARVTSLPAAILAEELDLGGMTLTLDAACASSIYAVKLACDELTAHRADAMLAGGVSRPECLYTQVGFTQLRALSSSGRCAPFDRRADGLVVGEGAGILVLKRLDDALAAGNRIYAVIHGIGLSNDMRGNLLAPDSEGQLRAMRAAYRAAQWNPQQIELIECHGAGTPTGDSTELHSLRTLWGTGGWEKSRCPIGSVKSNIGHLLTAAGAAGMIKTLLAMQEHVLPPSLNFEEPPPDSPLKGGPFRVQTEPEEWRRENRRRPRRAAVSAFGFGGINGHILFEEWDPEHHSSPAKPTGANIVLSEPEPNAGIDTIPVAIVGMDAVFGSLDSLLGFKEAVFNGRSVIGERPAHRWKGCDDLIDSDLNIGSLRGAYLDTLSIGVGEFHIPPSEIPDILPQHLLMLKVAAAAMRDAGLELRSERPAMGAVIGLDFDFEATNYHFRWSLTNAVHQWIHRAGIGAVPEAVEEWLQAMQESSGPPLTASRTLGALGGIVASRIAREFRFGGPSFGVSDGEASGIKALQIAARAIQQGEMDAAVVGAVDLFADVRRLLIAGTPRMYSKLNRLKPLDRDADGTLPGEGAAALILKALPAAVADGDRIYAVIKGVAAASGGGIGEGSPSVGAYRNALLGACADAATEPVTIELVETHGSGISREDAVELSALTEVFAESAFPRALGSVKSIIGHAGAASAAASLVKMSLCLFHAIIPPAVNFDLPRPEFTGGNRFHFPRQPQHWFRNRVEGPRRGCVCAMTGDGGCSAVVLEEARTEDAAIPGALRPDRPSLPLGNPPAGLFLVEGDSCRELLDGLHVLADWASAQTEEPVAALARRRLLEQPPDPNRRLACALFVPDAGNISEGIAEACKVVSSGSPTRFDRHCSVAFSPEPVGKKGGIAFVYPGSGNHFLGMGREIGLYWPEVLGKMDAATPRLKSQFLPHILMPQRSSWGKDWPQKAHEVLVSRPIHMLFGQVMYGCLLTELLGIFNIRPGAVVGYSLGETTGLFATKTWADREQMLTSMQATDLFDTRLSGPCTAARTAWNIDPDETFAWSTAVVNCPADAVKPVIAEFPRTRLLIVNTPGESVIGGDRQQVAAAVKRLGCRAYYLEGVVTVHCDAAAPAAVDYRALHLMPTTPPRGIRFYRCVDGRPYEPTRESAADSILAQALHGFDFTSTVRQAYEDGIRVFLEVGPGMSCTRMIESILGESPHVALAAGNPGENEVHAFIKCLGALMAERIPLNLERLYPEADSAPRLGTEETRRSIRISVGGHQLGPVAPGTLTFPEPREETAIPSLESTADAALPAAAPAGAPAVQPASAPGDSGASEGFTAPEIEHLKTWRQSMDATAEAHKQFLALSDSLSRSYGEAFELQNRLLEALISRQGNPNTPQLPGISPSASIGGKQATSSPRTPVVFSREQCMEFATGKIADVLGPEFQEVDSYAARVRLPDEPLMFVDRILHLEGRKGSLSTGRVVTEHDVRPGAWYLDGGRAPVCVAVEAGQADLFLCAYLGIDLAVKGQRVYRLLDASVVFHRDLPQPGETIRYDIRIDKFIRQGSTYMFFFRFEGTVDGRPLISMTDGCAGFFTEEEIRGSGGILRLPEKDTPQQGRRNPDWIAPLPAATESYDDAALDALRRGNLGKCFGKAFENVALAESLRLPAGRMKLIHRVLRLEAQGGRFGLGRIQAEADVSADAWYLTCHFVDDMTMPGTLMYECCAHSLRVFLLRLGWITDDPAVHYQPVQGIKSVLKCRGPVTPETKRVLYDVEIKEIGYGPEPYAVADAHMVADGRTIVRFTDMAIRMAGTTRGNIERHWRERPRSAIGNGQSPEPAPVFSRDQILEFACGLPSKAFGEPYQAFDRQRFIARLPGPPYSFIDRVVAAEHQAWSLEPDGWITAETDVQPRAWYFRANRCGTMPFAVLLEIALQSCGWLAAYAGSALHSRKDLHFRNLDGKAVLHSDLFSRESTLTVKSRLTKVSSAGEMIIEEFEFGVFEKRRSIYEGTTSFGFFTAEALNQQKGIQANLPAPFGDREFRENRMTLPDISPLTPQDPENESTSPPALAAKALRMIDRIDCYLPEGGPQGLGYIRGVKSIDPAEWYFKAHFHQDPVCPGSLGIESLLQLLKFVALQCWPHRMQSHRFEHVHASPHTWKYRGQILPANREITVEAVITARTETEQGLSEIRADGVLSVDGLNIYQMQDFGIRLVPQDS